MTIDRDSAGLRDGAGATGRSADAEERELVTPVLVVPLGIVTAGLYPVWAFLPRLARHRQQTGLMPILEEALDEVPSETPSGLGFSSRARLFTFAWVVLVALVVLGSVLPWERREPVFRDVRRAGAVDPRKYPDYHRRYAYSGERSVTNYPVVVVFWAGVFGVTGFCILSQAYVRRLLGATHTAELAALGRLAAKLGSAPPEMGMPELEGRPGRVLPAAAAVVAAIVGPPLVYFLATGFEARLFLLFVGYLSLLVAFLWGMLIAPLVNARLYRRHMRACRLARAWVKGRLDGHGASSEG